MSERYEFSEPLTPQEARTLLAHLPDRGAYIGNSVREAENPLLMTRPGSITARGEGTTFIRFTVRNAKGETVAATKSEPHKVAQIGSADFEMNVNGEPFTIQVSFVPEVIPAAPAQRRIEELEAALERIAEHRPTRFRDLPTPGDTTPYEELRDLARQALKENPDV